MVLPWNRRKTELKQKLSLLTNQVNTLQRNLTFEMGLKNINDSIALYPEWGVIDHINTYITSDQVFSVVTKVAETAAMIPLYAYEVKPDKKSLNSYKTKTNRQFYTSKGIWDIKAMQTKALEELPEDDRLNKLLDHPNPYQSKFEFFLAAYVFYLLKECFIYKYRLGDGANGGNPYQLYIFPPQNVIMHVTRQWPRTITSYTFMVEGVKVLENIPVSDIIHIKRFNPGCDLNGEDLRGLSPFTPGIKLLARMQAEDDAAVAQMQNGGLPGILFDESVQPDQQGQEQLDKKRKAFYDFVNASENKGAAWMTGGKLGYIATGLKLADMEVAALQKLDFKRLCNLYKVSDILFNSDVAATESNVKEQIRQLYTNSTLPLVYFFRDKLNNELVNEFSDKKARFIDCDISEITELQENLKETLDAISVMPGGLSLNEIRQLLNYDNIDLPYMDLPLLRQGYAFAENEIIPNVDDNLMAV